MEKKIEVLNNRKRDLAAGSSIRVLAQRLT
jgi:hypothetical protein